jgi:hypothetical protein
MAQSLTGPFSFKGLVMLSDEVRDAMSDEHGDAVETVHSGIVDAIEALRQGLTTDAVKLLSRILGILEV